MRFEAQVPAYRSAGVPSAISAPGGWWGLNEVKFSSVDLDCISLSSETLWTSVWVHPCRSVRLRPAPPNFSFEINKIAPQGAFCLVWLGCVLLGIKRTREGQKTSCLKLHQVFQSAMPRPMRILDSEDPTHPPPVPLDVALSRQVNHCSAAAI
jgi:hypothetical protein